MTLETYSLADTYPLHQSLSAHIAELSILGQIRNQKLDRLIDSDRSKPLPRVSLEPIEMERKTIDFEDVHSTPSIPEYLKAKTKHFTVKDKSEEPIGSVYIVEPIQQAGEKAQHYIGYVQIDEAKQKKGYGLATYLAILQSLPINVGLRSEGELSDGAKSIWQKLVDKGVARKIDNPESSLSAFETIL